jgi:hypothetical protein
LEFPARPLRQLEEIKLIQIGKDAIKLSLFSDDIILYIKFQKTPLKISQTL